MASVGEILRRERDRQGISLATISQQTRIKAQFLDALEKDRHDLLPGRFFIRSFALQYAENLGMNTDELLVALQRISGDLTPASPARPMEEPRLGTLFPERPALDPLPEGTASLLNAKKLAHSVAMLVSVVVVCGLLFWLWQSQMGTTSAESGHARSRQPGSETVAPPAAQPLPQTKPVETAAAQPAASTPAAPVATPEPPKADPPPPVVPAAKINLTLAASDRAWVRLVVDNKVIFEKLMVNGDTEAISGNVNAYVLTGSAGALAVKFNGSDIGALGPKGQIQVVDFTPGGYRMRQAYATPGGGAPTTQNAAPGAISQPGLN